MPRHAHYSPHGVIPAVLLPFADDLSIDEKSFPQHLRDVAAVDGLSAITINAHSTEVASCTFDEQRRVLDIAQDEIGGRLPIVNGVWADGSLEAARIARMAEDGGASALLVFPPAPFTLGQSPAMAVEHFKRIADASEPADHRLPVSAGDRAGLSARHALKDGRGGAGHPRHQGLGRQRAAARDAYPRAAKPPAPGERAHNPQRLAVLFAGARLQRPPLRLRQRDRRPAGGSCSSAVQGNDLAAAKRLNDRIYPLAEVFYAEPWADMHNRMKEALVLLGRLPRAVVRPPLVKLARAEIDRIRAALVEAGLLDAKASATRRNLLPLPAPGER